EGTRFDIYSSNIDQGRFIVLVFDRRQGPNRIGIVWLYTKRAVQDLYNLLVRDAA
ncbi:MAG: response regulator, partial [Chloroflexi bacterium]|nr:response regulator [Chloroflexota bacterium]